MLQEWLLTVSFSKRLAQIRKQRGLTQQALAELIGMNAMQIHRYEAGNTQPTLEAIRKLSIELSVTADELIFEKDERGPDEALRLQFEAISKFAEPEKQMISEILDALILKREAKRWSSPQKAKSA